MPKIVTEKVDDTVKWANLVTPLDSGTPLTGSSFYVHLGLQIGLNFVPETISKPAMAGIEIPKPGTRLSFFVR
jgi:hypothetical protein